MEIRDRGNRSRFRSRRSSDFDGGESSVGRKEAANLHRARHVRTRITGMSFDSSYFTLLRATMIGLSAHRLPSQVRIATAIRRCESVVDRFSGFLHATRLNYEKKKFILVVTYRYYKLQYRSAVIITFLLILIFI